MCKSSPAKRTRRCTTRTRTIKYQVWYGGKDADRKMDGYSNLTIAMIDVRFLLTHGWPMVIVRKVK